MAPRIGLVGFGRWGRHILRDLVSLKTEVTVVDRGGTAKDEARGAGAAGVVRTVDEVAGVDGVVVATPTTSHAEIVDALLPLGVPLFVEKPLTADPASASRIAAAAPDRVFVMEKWRYHPGVEALRDLIASGTLGAPRGLRSLRHQPGSQHRDVDGTWILVPHDLSIVREVLGEIPAPRAAVGHRRGNDTALVALLGERPWVLIDASTMAPAHRRELHVLGEEATAVLPDSYADHLEIRPLGSTGVERVPIPTELPLLRELRAFVEHVQGGPPPRSTAAEGAEVVGVIARLRSLAALDPA